MPRLSEHQRKLLKGAVKEEHGKFTLSYAEKYYSARQQARESIESLEKRGFVERETHGVFKIDSLPEEVYDQVEEHVKRLEAAKEEAGKDKTEETEGQEGVVERIKEVLPWN